MILTVGNKVVYPCQGPCLISSIVEKVVAGISKSFYQLRLLDDRGGELFVPVDRVQAMGIRLLLKKSEIPKLINKLKMKSEIAKNQKQRASDTLQRFTSGSAFDLAEIVESLTELGKTKALTLRESWALTRARTLLICEIAEVLGKTRSAAQQQVDQALEPPGITDINRRPKYLPVAELSQRI
ncbi:MAG: hypothetical protein KA368_19255 [Acidobacteria bacterium]|nr:hypothetical protein [Acidobacteriota bacterium]